MTHSSYQRHTKPPKQPTPKPSSSPKKTRCPSCVLCSFRPLRGGVRWFRPLSPLLLFALRSSGTQDPTFPPCLFPLMHDMFIPCSTPPCSLPSLPLQSRCVGPSLATASPRWSLSPSSPCEVPSLRGALRASRSRSPAVPRCTPVSLRPALSGSNVSLARSRPTIQPVRPVTHSHPQSPNPPTFAQCNQPSQSPVPPTNRLQRSYSSAASSARPSTCSTASRCPKPTHQL